MKKWPNQQIEATVNQKMPLSGQPKRFSFHMEINAKTTQVRPRNTMSHRLKAIIANSGCTTSVAFGLALLAKDESDKIVD
jgi:uncharacterized membrane protein